MVKDLTIARRFIMQKLAVGMLHISDQLHIEVYGTFSLLFLSLFILLCLCVFTQYLLNSVGPDRECS